MILAEYLRFLQTLNAEAITADIRKIANLVLQNIEALTPLSTSHGQRVKEIVKLAQKNWSSISSDIQPIQEQDTEQLCPISKLKSLSVGPFRGFAKQENFDLASRLVLIYGPNGTGKSSFCEALEYGLLGSVAEAESKRFRNQEEYLENAHTKSFEPPAIFGTDNQGKEIRVSANEAIFRFCFVEKNRIDNFSRIAAKSPAKQNELISTLFGLDNFTDFVRNFTDEMDGKHIDLEGVKAKELNKKREVLTGYQQQLNATIPEKLKDIDQEEKELVNQYNEKLTFLEMVAELNGSKEQTGLIKQLEEELQKQLPSKSNLTFAELEALTQSIETDIENLKTTQNELSKDSQQVSFKQLYEAVKQVQASSPEECPACHTPLSQVVVNPFNHADNELDKLHHLGQLQDDIKRLGDSINTSLTKLLDIKKTCCSRFPENNPLSAFQNITCDINSTNLWDSLHQPLTDGLTPLQHLDAQTKKLEEIDREIDQDSKTRTEKLAKQKKLRELNEKIIELKTRRETENKSEKTAKEAIESFNNENAKLISEVEAENADVTRNRAIAGAYASFVRKLNAYKEGLPAQLVADLGETVAQLYNAFNRNDAEHEKLATIRLPLQQNQRLEIAFKDEPEKYFDALHILSEGHIRCIGLSILTAKNIKENCPILIFDDPVNAIDDEHRESIRQTLFKDTFFDGKQIILACHGEEFFNRTHQIIGKEASKKVYSYLFLPKEDCHIRVNFLNSPKNYVLAARELFDTGESRDPLMYARRALENLTERAWYHYGKHSDKSDSLISVARRAPNQPWDLRCLADSLKKKFNKSKADIPNKDNIVDSLSTILGDDASQPPWTYLNKGTHDETDLPEFEKPIVNKIITALEQLDLALEKH